MTFSFFFNALKGALILRKRQMLNIVVPKKTRRAEQKLRHSKINWKKGILKGSKNAGNSVVRRADRLLTTGVRSGRKHPGLPNTSSAPGEFPRSQSGRLAQSLYSKAGSRFQFRIGATAPWATFLAKGTGNPDGSERMSPRKSKAEPWLEFVIEQEENITENYLHDGVAKEIC